ncbi:fructosamine kinase family protein [Cellulomonas sp. NTE-D12]|uniref:fructosamine kinase family protein n=1 Tax=Cellulomonas sp. NTE-D12 TaxID=2962632 RepID=UPI00308124C0|nr:fructosamine kinase [Cellulomonas sp. NTE-D12]
MTLGVHRKARAGAPRGFFACEAAGLRWLRAADAVPVVEVLDVAEDHLDLVRLEPAPASPRAARDLGRGLAALHDAGADAFGAPPDGWSGDGFFGPLEHPLPMASGRYPSWGAFLAECRLLPLAAELRRSSTVDATTLNGLARLADRLRSGALDDDDTPARLHGDLWSGNVVWTAAGATLVDPAAHGGHRETDLAMLTLFGLPHLDLVLAGYQDVHPLRRGWQHRVGLHQLYPVGVHALLFGGGYVEQLRGLVRAEER